MPVFALTIFAGAFLLFQVQPLIGKYILPWFGGGPGVWTTCMLFFQVLLLGGYGYAHLTSRRLKPRQQVLLHGCLLLAAVSVLPITPADSWKPTGREDPTWRILALLTTSIGLPYLVLSSTGPLMQQWFSRVMPGKSPYRLYALSNAGSLLALLSFPFYFETQFTRRIQATMWGWGLVLFAMACAYCAVKFWNASAQIGTDAVARPAPEHEPVPLQPAAPPSLSAGQRLIWLLLPASASIMLLATTNKLCQDVAVIPFLWVLPLALYLLSFIICFDNPRWYARLPFTLALMVSSAAVCWVLFEGTDASLFKQIAAYSSGLFVCCMVCHGELYRLKPDPSYLTGFYLMIAAGGALGGVFVALMAPFVFADYYELQWGLVLCVALLLVVWLRERPTPAAAGNPDAEHQPETSAGAKQWPWLAGALGLLTFVGIDRGLAGLVVPGQPVLKVWITGLRIGLWLFLVAWVGSLVVRKKFNNFRHWHGLACAWLFLGIVTLGGALWKEVRGSTKERIYSSRNFYGVLSVYEYNKDQPQNHYLLLQHGAITHGLQFVEPSQAILPTTYYGAGSGIQLAMQALSRAGRRLGVVGLGTGTLTALAQPGDYVRLYEINPEVIRLANSTFTYLSNCPGKVEIALGDARLSMEREAPQRFDLLALDAFSSDAIPVHLLTREAFELYQKHLDTNGVIAVHISNHYLDLEPVVVKLARHFNYQIAKIDYDEDTAEADWWYYSSTWLLLTHNDAIIKCAPISAAATALKTNTIPLWTDDFASLFQILQ